MAKRVSLSERRAQDVKGVDAIFESTQPIKTESSPKELVKVTLYVRPDQILTIEKIQLAEREKTGKKPDKSDLIQEAIDLLAEKYGI